MDAGGVHRECDLGVAVEMATFGGLEQVLHQVPGFGSVQPDECDQRERERCMFGEHVAFAGAGLLGGDGGIDVLTSGRIVALEHGDHGARRREPGIARLGVADLGGELCEHGFRRVESSLEDADVGNVGGMAFRVQGQTMASVDRRFRRGPDVDRVAQAARQGRVDVALWQCLKHINRKRLRQEAPLVHGPHVPIQQRIEIVKVPAYHVAAEQCLEHVAVDARTRPGGLEGVEDLRESTFVLRPDGQGHGPGVRCGDTNVGRRRAAANAGPDQFVIRPPNVRLGQAAAEQGHACLRQDPRGAVHTDPVGCDDTVGLRD